MIVLELDLRISLIMCGWSTQWLLDGYFNDLCPVTCLSTINCLKKRQRQKLRRADLVPEVVQEELNSKLTPLGIVGEPLRLVRVEFEVQIWVISDGMLGCGTGHRISPSLWSFSTTFIWSFAFTSIWSFTFTYHWSFTFSLVAPAKQAGTAAQRGSKDRLPAGREGRVLFEELRHEGSRLVHEREWVSYVICSMSNTRKHFTCTLHYLIIAR